MTIVIACNEEYYNKGKIFFESVWKNWKNRVCILCIDFDPPDKRVGWEYATCDAEKLPSYRLGWPVNRDFFVCCEGGDFFDYFSFDDNELIIHTDVDMIMQRPLSPSEKQLLDHFRQGDIGMSASAKPTMSLREEYFRLRPKRNYLKTNKDFPGRLGSIPLYCSGVIVARVATYKTIGAAYIASIDKMIANFDHHAAGQWLFSWLVTVFNVIDLGNTFHNASWFFDTDAVEGDYLTHGENGQIVLFNHTKFLKEYLY
jgi:hypothetical protein